MNFFFNFWLFSPLVTEEKPLHGGVAVRVDVERVVLGRLGRVSVEEQGVSPRGRGHELHVASVLLHLANVAPHDVPNGH